MRRILTAITLVLAAVFSVLYLARGTLALPLMGHLLPRVLSADLPKSLGDGLHIGVCGAGGPLGDPLRSGPCLVVMAGENLLLVDSGSGGIRKLAQMRIPTGQLDAVLLTHFHSDHIDGLGETATLRWAGGANTSPLPVIGPTGVKQVVDGFNMAYAQDMVYRHDHHGNSVAPLSGKGLAAQPFALPQNGEGRVVWNENGLKVTAFAVAHEPVKPAVGYRFDYAGRSAVISGDTSQSKNLEYFSKGVDLLFHEALSRRLVGAMNSAAKTIGNPVIEKITFDILDYHASPTEAAHSARTAGARHLVFYHIVPPLIVPGADKVFLNGVNKIYKGPVTLSRDGTLLSLPANDSAILLVKAKL
ncbi:MAG: MBL fold metallo-hydrolase [Pseudomonadales bacterium]